MPFYGQRKRVWKTSFWSWKGDAASIMPGPYSLTVTILRQIKRWQFSRQRVLKYVSISFEDDIRDTSRIYAGRDGAGTTQELWCWLSMTETLTGSSSLSLGGWHSWCQSKEIIAMHKRSWKDFFACYYHLETPQEINKHLPTTGKSCVGFFSTSKTTYKKSM